MSIHQLNERTARGEGEDGEENTNKYETNKQTKMRHLNEKRAFVKMLISKLG